METVSIYVYLRIRYVLEYSSSVCKNTGYSYNVLVSMSSVQVLDMYLNIQVLGTCMSSIYMKP